MIASEDRVLIAAWLEQFLQDTTKLRWSQVPQGARRLFEKTMNQGSTAGIAKHPRLGWFVLLVGNQHSHIGWMECSEDMLAQEYLLHGQHKGDNRG